MTFRTGHKNNNNVGSPPPPVLGTKSGDEKVRGGKKKRDKRNTEKIRRRWLEEKSEFQRYLSINIKVMSD